MRLWSLHPKYLDTKGLLALWREGLLARKVLRGETKGYRNHPQLLRFKETAHPQIFMEHYLHAVVEEARRRRYAFDVSKLDPLDELPKLEPLDVTTGQLAYELTHLSNKLQTRAPDRYNLLLPFTEIETHPLFRVIPGEIAPWEKKTTL